MKMNKKGFTLMEMLIVVAIIAILVAIAIPSFSGALKKANIATDKANVRAAYAEALVEAMAAENDDVDVNSKFTEPALKVTGATVTTYGTKLGDFKVVYDPDTTKTGDELTLGESTATTANP